jgi:hypothetical protein
MTSATMPLPRRRVRANVDWRGRRRWQGVAMIVAFIVLALVIEAMVPLDARPLLAPALALAAVGLFFLTALWVREGRAPVFETGTLWVGATTIYGTIPMIGFAMMRGQWHPLSDSRLQQYPYKPRLLAHFGWNYVVYELAFVIVYLLIRGNANVRTTYLRKPSRPQVWAIIGVFGGIELVRTGMKFFFGIDIEASYSDFVALADAIHRMPLIVMQFVHNILAARLVVEQALIALLFLHWRKRSSRVLLVLWLIWVSYNMVTGLGSRSPYMAVIVSAGMLYHRLVKPVSFRVFLAAGLILLTVFLGVGLYRSLQVTESTTTNRNLLTTGNEFQALFATAYDLHERRKEGSLDVPWQVYVIDLYLMIPHQLLPFEKIDPAQWYLEIIGLANGHTGFMFGVMAEAVVGWGRIELMLRGALLAAVLALFHRWYARHAAGFWSTLLYLFVSLWTYYTFRATTFWFLYIRHLSSSCRWWRS